MTLVMSGPLRGVLAAAAVTAVDPSVTVGVICVGLQIGTDFGEEKGTAQSRRRTSLFTAFY